MEREMSQFLTGKGKLLNFLLLGRPWNGIIIGLISSIGYLMLASTVNPLIAIGSFLVFLFLYIGGTTLNDIYDYKVDTHNMQFRPLQMKKITILEAKIFALVSFVIGGAIAYLISTVIFAALIFFIFAVLYSVHPISIKDRGAIGNLVLSFVTIFFPGMGGVFAATNSIALPQNAFVTLLATTFLFFGISILKDYKDMKGDLREKKNTFALKIGKTESQVISVVFVILLFPISVFLFSTFLPYQEVFYIISSFLLIVLIEIILEKNTKEDAIFEEKRFTKARLALFFYFLTIFILLLLKIQF